MSSIAAQIARELSVEERQVHSATALLDEGATVPFIARYRKEATGGLDDAQLRTLEERLRYLGELEERRETDGFRSTCDQAHCRDPHRNWREKSSVTKSP